MIAIPIPAERHRQQMSILSDADLVPLAKAGDEPAIRTIVQRHNQRLFRTARAVIRNDAEAEDVVQAAYIKAFTNLATFRGEAQLSTWLTRITLNEALGRVRARKNTTGLEEIDMQTMAPGGEVLQFPSSLSATNPETELARSQARHLLENAVDELPDDFRAVFVLRDVEGMSTDEAASYLGIRPETAKTRLHRARKMMRHSIEKQLSGAFSALFPFDGARCAFMADRVIAALRHKTL
ncbi:RNA polymerase sigma factor (plasmid) [Rhizobium leguminosarum]|jgi:RNA polymerase sigma-70 factor (ECF subfamily)|uniref:RNA polymerase sigma factor n=3 Tax=Rhizobium leguminosarum TaxID=384 RepID=A0A1B8RCU5_RHILT|nr:RNA polymerase sigma factor [Rhizobium leguminosarum]MDH6660521.1 RNA polymerase sigma-70 factor (ECF subfamily) [Rhizobium sophorae]AOO90521.1 RNA polymerase sigma factor [Rhizobium leguminosarum bv. trifolii]ASS58297.1 RNA polymerase subunit sigma [Rhizobium leguminosarum bv. viciae]AVC47280.1 RNA polymerase sigma factor, sigma-70 family protein [Rhizobium leguminosarum bv. viciae]MBB4329702.1 RNA polymerase sigma-70 factor (ECF subfamily) [Rhizobium leguminosarum]